MEIKTVLCAAMAVWCAAFAAAESVPMMARQLATMEKRYPYDVWLFADYEDDEWPSTRQADLFKEWNAKWKWPQLRTCGRLDEPFDRVKARWGDKIPVLRGEMTSGWLQHAACTPELLARKMAADRALARAETLTAVKSARDKEAYPMEDFRRAWDALIWNDEHSYGVSGYSGRRVFETWMQHRDWIERALNDLDEEYYGSSMSLSRYDLNVGSPAWNVQLLTLKRAEDGRGLIARFREREGRPCRVTASQHLAPDAEYTLCNVVERDVRNKALITE